MSHHSYYTECTPGYTPKRGSSSSSRVAFVARSFAFTPSTFAIDRSLVHSCPVSSSFVGHALDRETRARAGNRRATAGAMKGRFRPRATATATTTTRGGVSERHHRHRRALESSRERDVSRLVR